MTMDMKMGKFQEPPALLVKVESETLNSAKIFVKISAKLNKFGLLSTCTDILVKLYDVNIYDTLGSCLGAA